MCLVLRVAHSGWYVWRRRSHQPGPRPPLRLICAAAVRKAFTEAKQRYGAPRLTDELPEYNIKTITAEATGKSLSPVSYREHGLPVLENLLKQDFCVSDPKHK